MNCSEEIHGYRDEVICPFCNGQIKERVVRIVPCCPEMKNKIKIKNMSVLKMWSNRWI